jgi:hypothetical protein
MTRFNQQSREKKTLHYTTLPSLAYIIKYFGRRKHLDWHLYTTFFLGKNLPQVLQKNMAVFSFLSQLAQEGSSSRPEFSTRNLKQNNKSNSHNKSMGARTQNVICLIFKQIICIECKRVLCRWCLWYLGVTEQGICRWLGVPEQNVCGGW